MYYFITLTTERYAGIPKIHVGLIGMIPAIGFFLNGFYDILDYLLHARKFSLRAVQSVGLAVVIVNIAGWVGVFFAAVAASILS